MEAPRREIVLPRAAYLVAAILLGGGVVYGLRDVLTPIFLAFLIAFLQRHQVYLPAVVGKWRHRTQGHVDQAGRSKRERAMAR